MFRSSVHPMEKALTLGLVAVAAILILITLVSPKHGWVLGPGQAALAAAEARDAQDAALISSAP